MGLAREREAAQKSTVAACEVTHDGFAAFARDGDVPPAERRRRDREDRRTALIPGWSRRASDDEFPAEHDIDRAPANDHAQDGPARALAFDRAPSLAEHVVLRQPSER